MINIILSLLASFQVRLRMSFVPISTQYPINCCFCKYDICFNQILTIYKYDITAARWHWLVFCTNFCYEEFVISVWRNTECVWNIIVRSQYELQRKELFFCLQCSSDDEVSQEVCPWWRIISQGKNSSESRSINDWGGRWRRETETSN